MNLLLQVCFLILIFVTHSIYPNFPQVKQVDSTVEAGAQFQQVLKSICHNLHVESIQSFLKMVNVECVSDFNEQPDLHLSFYYNGVMHNVDIKLPVSDVFFF